MANGRRRFPILMGALFVIAAVAYYVVQGGRIDLAGTTMLLVLGLVMTFTLYVLMDGVGGE